MKQMRPIACLVALVFFATSGPAASQLFYSGGSGTLSSLTGPNLPSPELRASNRSANELATLFQRLCIVPEFDTVKTEAMLADVNWKPSRSDGKVPFDKPEYADPVQQWLGDGMALVLVPQTIGPPTGRRFRIDGPQCNLVTAPGEITSETLTAALSDVLGAPPSNSEDMIRKGKPNKQYQPEWSVTSDDGRVRRVGIAVFPPRSTDAGKLMISVLPPTLPGK